MASVIDILFRCEAKKVSESKRSRKAGGEERSLIRAKGLSTNEAHPRRGVGTFQGEYASSQDQAIRIEQNQNRKVGMWLTREN